MRRQDRQGLPDLLAAALLAGGAFTVYALTLAPTVLAGDGGEFQFVPYLLGVAHPTGYPLYCILGWVWSHLVPVGDVAYRMNLFSAFWAALAVGLLYLATCALLRRAFPKRQPSSRCLHRVLATAAATTFAVTPTFWSQAIIAEVYSLHLFFLVALFYLLLLWAERRTRLTLILAAGTFGLSLTHHSTTLLLVPAILVFLWLTDRAVFRDIRRIAQGLLFALLPLALYLYLPLRAPHTPYLHLPLEEGRALTLYDNTLAGLLRFVSGGPFGGSVDLTVDLPGRLSEAWGFLRGELGWAALALALIGLAHLALARRWSLLALTGLTCVASAAFNLVYTIGDIYVLYIPSYLMLVLWMAMGAGALAEGGARLTRHKLAPALLATPLLLLPLWMGIDGWTGVDQSQNRSARARWEAILDEPLPPSAILVSDDRNDIMPMWYAQYVEGRQPDLLGLFPLITADHPSLGHILDLALGSGRPTYLIKEMPGIEIKVRTEAQGSLWRVLGPAVDSAPAYPVSARFGDVLALVGYDRPSASPRPGDTLQVYLTWEALHPLAVEYHSFVHLLDASGQKVTQSDHKPGGVYYPTTLWQPGERLRDQHHLDIPAGTPAGVYRLIAGMYALSDGDALEPLGQPAVIGQVAVKTGMPTEPGPLAHTTQAVFDSQVELIGYDAAVAGELLTVDLCWRCLKAVPADYTIFVHLLSAQGERIAQHDSQPQGGAYPTSVWDAGEVIVDRHQLALPSDRSALAGGEAYLAVGLYLLETGERLPLASGADHVKLGPIPLRG